MGAQSSEFEIFEETIADAFWLLKTAQALSNHRSQRLRTERRVSLAVALNLPKMVKNEIDAIESDDLFIVIKPGSRLDRNHVKDLGVLYRQAIVAASAAVETYVAESTLRRAVKILRSKQEPPKRLGDLKLSLNEWWHIENYERRGTGIREVVLKRVIPEYASPSADRVGKMLSMVGVDSWAQKVDRIRNVRGGTSVLQLDELAHRRNRIAHTGDRVGRKRTSISFETARDLVANAEQIVIAIDKILKEIDNGFGEKT